MVSIEEVNEKLAALYLISGVSGQSAELTNLIVEKRFDEAFTNANDRLALIQKILESQMVGESSNLFEPLERRLTAEQYVLPLEMEKVHPVVLANITSGKSIEHFSFGGLLLYDDDVGGTGKTEYPFFLAEQADKNVRFVKANGNAIRESSKPGTILKNLYHELEKKAIVENVIYVIFIDEFEKLVNKYAKHHTNVTEEHSDSSSEKRAFSESRKETKKTLEVDQKGEELFSTLKTLISGAEGINQVFTIAASNQSTYPVTLLRRLEPVELRPFGIVKLPYQNETIPDYGSLNESFARAFQVLQATHYRLNEGVKSLIIERIENEVLKLMEDLRKKYGSPYTTINEHRDNIFGNNIYHVAQRNNAYLKVLLNYFDCNLIEEQKIVDINWNILQFAGQFNIENEHRFGQHGHFHNDETSEEVLIMMGLTPDKVAKWYKSNKNIFIEYESAKKYIGECFFPQLKTLEEYKMKPKKKV